MAWLIVIGVVCAWLFGKLLKTIVFWAKEGFGVGVLFYDGGMPSLHTISVVSLSTGLFLEQGFSALFVLSVVFGLIVINDAFKVRRITQEQSVIINRLTRAKKGFKQLDEHVGHSLGEVLVGIIIGVVIPLVVRVLSVGL